MSQDESSTEKMKAFVARILKGANVGHTIDERHTRITRGGELQAEHEAIMDVLSQVRLEKVLAYGEDRFDVTDRQHELLMCYSDLYRKFIRLKKMVFTTDYAATHRSSEALLDNAVDLAGYAIMMVHILFKLEQKGL